MNILKREFKANLKPLIIWCVAQVFVILAGMMKYVGFAESGTDINELFATMPEGLMKAFGISDVNIATVDGFYTVFFLYFMLLASSHAVMFGAVVVSKEERDHSADFLFSKPVKRHVVITYKFIAGLINIAILNIATLVTSVVMIAQNNDGDGLLSQVALLMIALGMIQIFFLALGFLLGAVLKTTKLATSAATGFVLATFFMSILADLSEKVEFLKYITPFKAYESSVVMFDREIAVLPSIALIGFSICFLAMALKMFYDRDLTT